MKTATTIKLTTREERFVYALAYGLVPTRAAKVAKREGSIGEVETGA